MKRPLTKDDYVHMVWHGVDELFPETHPRHELYRMMAHNSFDSFRRYGYRDMPEDLAYRKHLLYEVYTLESDISVTLRPLANMIAEDSKTYRVSLNTKGGVEVICFDLESVDSELEGYYDEVSALPVWVQEKVAVLAVCSPEPPTHPVEGIGRRISENIYWVYK